MVFPFSNHNFDLRYWLAAAGVHPDRDVRLVAIPPPLMVDSLRAGLVDGFCVGEPWNSLAVAQGLGSIVATQSQLFPRAAEKVLAVRAAFAEQRGALSRSCCARSMRRQRGPTTRRITPSSRRISRGRHISASAADSLRRARRTAAARRGRRACTIAISCTSTATPRTRRATADGLWAYAQMVRWGQLAPSERCRARRGRRVSPDLYRQQRAPARARRAAVLPFDRVEFSATDVRGVSATVRRAHAVHGRQRSLTLSRCTALQRASAPLNHSGARNAVSVTLRLARRSSTQAGSRNQRDTTVVAARSGTAFVLINATKGPTLGMSASRRPFPEPDEHHAAFFWLRPSRRGAEARYATIDDERPRRET